MNLSFLSLGPSASFGHVNSPLPVWVMLILLCQFGSLWILLGTAGTGWASSKILCLHRFSRGKTSLEEGVAMPSDLPRFCSSYSHAHSFQLVLKNPCPSCRWWILIVFYEFCVFHPMFLLYWMCYCWPIDGGLVKSSGYQSYPSLVWWWSVTLCLPSVLEPAVPTIKFPFWTTLWVACMLCWTHWVVCVLSLNMLSSVCAVLTHWVVCVCWVWTCCKVYVCVCSVWTCCKVYAVNMLQSVCAANTLSGVCVCWVWTCCKVYVLRWTHWVVCVCVLSVNMLQCVCTVLNTLRGVCVCWVWTCCKVYVLCWTHWEVCVCAECEHAAKCMLWTHRVVCVCAECEHAAKCMCCVEHTERCVLSVNMLQSVCCEDTEWCVCVLSVNMLQSVCAVLNTLSGVCVCWVWTCCKVYVLCWWTHRVCVLSVNMLQSVCAVLMNTPSGVCVCVLNTPSGICTVFKQSYTKL